MVYFSIEGSSKIARFVQDFRHENSYVSQQKYDEIGYFDPHTEEGIKNEKALRKEGRIRKKTCTMPHVRIILYCGGKEL